MAYEEFGRAIIKVATTTGLVRRIDRRRRSHRNLAQHPAVCVRMDDVTEMRQPVRKRPHRGRASSEASQTLEARLISFGDDAKTSALTTYRNLLR